MTVSPEDEVLGYLDEVREEMGNVRGWKSEAARRLEIDPSYVSHLLRGRQPSMRILKKVRGVRNGSPTTHGDPEFRAMEALAALSEDARRRVMTWAASRWGDQ